VPEAALKVDQVAIWVEPRWEVEVVSAVVASRMKMRQRTVLKVLWPAVASLF
jgi:hypothetical protein